MGRQELDHLAHRLSEVLGEIDAAIRARFTDANRRETKRRRHEATRRREGLRSVAAATLLRWLAGSAGSARGPNRSR